MATQLQLRRGTTSETGSFTGAVGEVTVDTTKDTLVVHDGSTAGGHEVAKNDGSNMTAIDVGDNVQLKMGASDDFKLYHNGNNSFIEDAGNGDLYIRAADNLRIQSYSDNEDMIKAVKDGAVTLYNNGSPKIATTSSGVDVTGSATMDGLTVNGTANGDTYFTGGTANARLLNVFTSTHDSSAHAGHNFKIASGAGAFIFGNNTTANLLTVKSGGVDVTGTATMDGLKVGSGTTTPWNSADDLVVNATTTAGVSVLTPDSSNGRFVIGSASDTDYLTIEGFYNSGSPLGRIRTGGNIAMTFDNSQNVSIPSGTLGIGDTPVSNFAVTANLGYRSQAALPNFTLVETDSSNQTWQINSTGAVLALRDMSRASDRLTIDTAGNVSVPNGNFTVGAGSASSGVTVTAASNIGQVNIGKTYSGGTSAANFRHNNGLVGQIYYDNTSTAYITSSDYRLKEDWQPMSGATDRLKELKPVNFAWKVDGSRVDGFLAHEAQEVVPESVTGSKDGMMTEEYEVSAATGDIYTPEVVAVEGVEAVEYVAPQDEVLDEEGNVVTEAVAEVMAVEAVEAVEGVAEVIHSADVEQPSELEEGQLWRETTAQVMGEREVADYQGIDQSKLVPLLVATIQELEARITALEA